MIEQLKEQIKVVAIAREHARKAVVDRNSSYAEWEVENTPILDRVRSTGEAVFESEATLRELTLQAYAETGNKAPAPGVGIREMTILTYDNKVAFDWAKAHKMALKLDTEAFKKIAKADPPDFVKITTEPQATIATHLEEIK